MAFRINVRSVHLAASRSLLPGECFECASPKGTRNPRTSRFINCLSNEGWIKGPALKLKLQVFPGGLRVKERDIHVQRFPCRRKVRASAVEDKQDKRLVRRDSDDSSLKSPQDASGQILFSRSIVQEIVDNLADAPFMRYAYFNDQGRKPIRHLLSNEVFEKPETWGPVRKLLSEASPDGIILVQRLGLVEDLRDKPKFKPKPDVRVRRHDELRWDQSVEEYWGVFVHGCKVRQDECHLLKTTRMISALGIVTFYVLIEAECFGPSISTQFLNVLRHPYR